MFVSGNRISYRIDAVNSNTASHSNLLDSHKLKQYMTELRSLTDFLELVLNVVVIEGPSSKVKIICNFR